MSDHDRFRGQDLNDEYLTDDDAAATTDLHEAIAMQQEQGGRVPAQDAGISYAYGHQAEPTGWDYFTADTHPGDGYTDVFDDDEFPEEETAPDW